mmetsp:Transcript_16976/g.37091  ORF Transcript_16976/g.37091 Transcript_16976/m.37091 type:complete len:260 (-) Transcript_16976:1882-2661(-)
MQPMISSSAGSSTGAILLQERDVAVALWVLLPRFLFFRELGARQNNRLRPLNFILGDPQVLQHLAPQYKESVLFHVFRDYSVFSPQIAEPEHHPSNTRRCLLVHRQGILQVLLAVCCRSGALVPLHAARAVQLYFLDSPNGIKPVEGNQVTVVVRLDSIVPVLPTGEGQCIKRKQSPSMFCNLFNGSVNVVKLFLIDKVIVVHSTETWLESIEPLVVSFGNLFQPLGCQKGIVLVKEPVGEWSCTGGARSTLDTIQVIQ